MLLAYSVLPKNHGLRDKDALSTYNNRTTSVVPSRIRAILTREMAKAKRQRYWFRLNRLDRIILSLTLRSNAKYKSLELLRVLVGILKRLKELGDRLYIALRRGAGLAWLYSEAAVGWGNAQAHEWRNDIRYVEFLGSLFGGRLS